MIKSIAAVLIFLLGVASLAFVLPNMDEFVQYHLLACFTHDFSSLNTFRESCDESLRLQFLGVSLPIRATAYIGSFAGWLYFPFLLLSKSFISARIYCGLILFTMVMSIKKQSNASLLVSVTSVFLLFPLVLMTVMDSGPCALQILIALSMPWLFSCALNEHNSYKKIIYLIILNVSIFAAVEIKPYFLYVLPFFLIHSYFEAKVVWRRFLLSIVPAMIALAVYFFSKTMDGNYYIFELIGVSKELVSPPIFTKSWRAILDYVVTFRGYWMRHKVIPPLELIQLLSGMMFISIMAVLFLKKSIDRI